MQVVRTLEFQIVHVTKNECNQENIQIAFLNVLNCDYQTSDFHSCSVKFEQSFKHFDLLFLQKCRMVSFLCYTWTVSHLPSRVPLRSTSANNLVSDFTHLPLKAHSILPMIYVSCPISDICCAFVHLEISRSGWNK